MTGSQILLSPQTLVVYHGSKLVCNFVSPLEFIFSLQSFGCDSVLSFQIHKRFGSGRVLLAEMQWKFTGTIYLNITQCSVSIVGVYFFSILERPTHSLHHSRLTIFLKVSKVFGETFCNTSDEHLESSRLL